MSEAQDAAFYQQHRDDEQEWGDAVERPVRRRSERRRLAAMVSVRFSAEEASLIRLAATREGTSLSNFLRTAALGAAGGSSGGVSLAVASKPEGSIGFGAQLGFGQEVVLPVLLTGWRA